MSTIARTETLESKYGADPQLTTALYYSFYDERTAPREATWRDSRVTPPYEQRAIDRAKELGGGDIDQTFAVMQRAIDALEAEFGTGSA